MRIFSRFRMQQLAATALVIVAACLTVFGFAAPVHAQDVPPHLGELVAGVEMAGEHPSLVTVVSLADSGYLEHSDAEDWIPALRWRDATGLKQACGASLLNLTKGLQCSINTGIANLLFSLAAFIWWVILSVVHLATSLSPRTLPDLAGDEINGVFLGLTQSIAVSGLLAIAMLVTALRMFSSISKGRKASLWRRVTAAALPLVALTVMAGAVASERATSNGQAVATSSGAPAVSPANPGSAPGSPLWIASSGLDVVQQLTGGISGALTRPTFSGDTDGVSCGAYLAAMDDIRGYLSDSSDAGLQTTATLGELWQQSYLPHWATAQYGTAQLDDNRMWCHQMEEANGTPRFEQVLIGNVAGYPTVDLPAGATTGDGRTLAEVIAESDLADDTCAESAMFNPGQMEIPATIVDDPCAGYGISSGGLADSYFDAVLGTVTGGVMGGDGAHTRAWEFANRIAESRQNGFDDPDASYVASADIDRSSWVAQTDGRRDPYNSAQYSNDALKYFNALYPFQACVFEDGQWQLQASWFKVSQAAAEEYGGETFQRRHCNEWYYLGVAPGHGADGWGSGDDNVFDTAKVPAGNVVSATVAADAPSGIAEFSDGHDTPQDVRRILGATFGSDLTQSSVILWAFVALITALVLMVAIGSIAIGAVIANIGFAVLLALLPVTLILLVIGGRQENNPGRQLLRMTAAFAGTAIAMNLGLAFILFTSHIVNSFALSLAPGPIANVLVMISPLAAVFILKRIFERLGFGDVTSMRGAAAAVLAAGSAARHTGDVTVTDPVTGKKTKMSARKHALDRHMTEGFGKRKLLAPTKPGALSRMEQQTKDTVKAGKDALTERVGTSVDRLRHGRLSDGEYNNEEYRRLAVGRAGVLTAAESAGRLANRLGEESRFGRMAATAGEHITRFKENLIPSSEVQRTQRDNAMRLKGFYDEALAETGDPDLAASVAVGRIHQDMQESLAGERDVNGNVLTDADGKKIYGFAAITPSGRIRVDANEAGWNAETKEVAPGFEAVVDFAELPVLSSAVVNEQRRIEAADMGVSPHHVLVSAFGTPPTLNAPTDRAGRLDIDPRDFSREALERMGHEGTLFFSEEVHRAVNSLETDEAKAELIANVRMSAGLVDVQGQTVSAAERVGLSTTQFNVAIDELLEGNSRAMDDYRLEISAEGLNRAVAAARITDRRQGALSSRAEVDASVSQVLNDIAKELTKLDISAAHANLDNLREHQVQVANGDASPEMVAAVSQWEQEIAKVLEALQELSVQHRMLSGIQQDMRFDTVTADTGDEILRIQDQLRRFATEVDRQSDGLDALMSSLRGLRPDSDSDHRAELDHIMELLRAAEDQQRAAQAQLDDARGATRKAPHVRSFVEDARNWRPRRRIF